MSAVYAAAVERIQKIVSGSTIDGVLLIAIDGPAGAGKSTLARAVAARLGAPLIEIDDFFCWGSLDSWWPRFIDQVAAPLLRGEEAHYQVRDWLGDEFGESLLGSWKTVRWHPVVVVEGVSSSRAALEQALACRVWVEAPFEERLRRGVGRDGESHRQLWLRYMHEEERFFAEDRTRERADVVVDGAGSAEA